MGPGENWKSGVRVKLNAGCFTLVLSLRVLLSKNDLAAFIRTVKKLVKMDLVKIQKSSGLNLEKISVMKTPAGKSLYSIRVTRSFRAVLTVGKGYLRFVSLHPDHDSAYKRC
jgi:hypothetical protein